MQKLSSFSFVLAAALLVSAAAFANSGGEMKNSPLFKASLEQSIAKLEGKVKTTEETPTSKGSCPTPNAPPTQISTCYPSWCGGETCFNTCDVSCFGTCGSQTTCGSTCSETCVGSGSTYENGACCNARFYGTVSYKNTWYGWPSGTAWAAYLSGYTDLLDYDMWNWIWPYGGGVLFQYGSGYNEDISLGLFHGFGGGYDRTITVPDVSNYKIAAGMSSYYEGSPESIKEHKGEKLFSNKPIASRKVDIRINIYRP